MIAGWLDLVEALDAGTAIAALPAPVQDLFSHVDPGSTVCVKKYRKKIEASCDQRKILFKGGKVTTRHFADREVADRRSTRTWKTSLFLQLDAVGRAALQSHRSSCTA